MEFMLTVLFYWTNVKIVDIWNWDMELGNGEI